MNKQVFIPTESQFREILKNTVDSLLAERIPQIIRRANRKEYITTKEFKELFGVSHRTQQYYRDHCGLPYVQQNKKIWYETAEVETFMKDRKINAHSSK
jgi:hypothetical protein